MYYKQIIIVNKELNMSKGKMAAQVSHASMAFITHIIQNNTSKRIDYRYNAWKNEEMTIPQYYKRMDLNKWAEETRNKGEKYFYAKPVEPKDPCGKLELCEPSYYYETHMNIDKDIYEQWMSGYYTKVILSAKNENQMKNIVQKAEEAGLINGEDFFCIRDACFTELTPDETGTRWTCIGFKPMNAEDIDPITKRLQLFKE